MKSRFDVLIGMKERQKEMKEKKTRMEEGVPFLNSIFDMASARKSCQNLVMPTESSCLT